MKLLCRLILFLIIALDGAYAQVSIDRTDASNYTDSSTWTHSSFVIGNHLNRLLIVGLTDNNTADNLVSVTFNGVGNTKIVTASAGNATSQLWYLSDGTNPAITTADIVATLSGANSGALNIVSVYGANTSSPIRDMDSATGSTEQATSLTLTTQADDIVISCMRVRDEGATDPGNLVPNSGTELTEFYNGFNARTSCLYRVATTTSTSVGWTWSGSNTEWSHVAATIAKATAAPLTSIPSIFKASVIR